MRFLLCSVLCLLFAVPLRAEDLLAKVQRELRARKFYFGEINGHATDETVSAIGKFQRAHGIDQTGNLDGETLRSLGLPNEAAREHQETSLLEQGNRCVLEYLRALESGNWEREAAFLAEVVNYYDDQNVSREFIHDLRVKELRQWPHRKMIMLNRVASPVPEFARQVQVTARIRCEVTGESGTPRARTEDIVFRLQKVGENWRIAALKLLE